MSGGPHDAAMRMTDAIQSYLADMRSEGRLTSDSSERAYYDVLRCHSDDVNNRDPRTTNRDDVKRTLARWANPNTQANRRAILVSFYRWTVQEGLRPYNPAEQTRPPKKQPTEVYRLTADECRRLMAVAEHDPLEKRAIHLGICAGARRAELLGLQGRHFRRAGWIWISKDIGKGGRSRWIPAIADILDLAVELGETLADDEYMLPGAIAGLAGKQMGRTHRLLPRQPMGKTTLYDLVADIGRRAGIAAPIHPHLLRHAFCDHIAKLFGLEVAQQLMGHADVGTTRGYTGDLTPDELHRLVAETTFKIPPGAIPLTDPPKYQQYRHGDSNPGFTDSEEFPHGGLNISPAEEGL